MRILFDANVFISYLLSAHKRDKDEKIRSIVDAGFTGRYKIIFPRELIEEIRKKVKEKPYLTKHITQTEFDEFIEILSSVAEILPPLNEPIPEISRDKKDDYLLAYGTVGDADYVVTGDEDLQVLKEIGKLKIVSPMEFFELLLIS